MIIIGESGLLNCVYVSVLPCLHYTRIVFDIVSDNIELCDVCVLRPVVALALIP